jgi:hypothetical protein
MSQHPLSKKSKSSKMGGNSKAGGGNEGGMDESKSLNSSFQKEGGEDGKEAENQQLLMRENDNQPDETK